jgi:hypothetical protein
MKQQPLLIVFALISLSLPAMADPVEVAGFQMVGKVYGAGENNQLVPFNTFKTGLEIALGFGVKDGGIISIDEDASVLTKFTDDKGTDLVVKEFGRKGFGPFPKQSDDGKNGLVSLTTTKLPAAAATKVMASGKIAMTTAGAKKTERTKVLPLKQGGTFALGKTNFKINKAEASGDSMDIELETTDDISLLAEVRFVGPGNAKLESDRRGSGSMSFAGKKTTTVEYSIKGTAASVIVEADVWQDAKKVELPFDITVTLPVAVSN